MIKSEVSGRYEIIYVDARGIRVSWRQWRPEWEPVAVSESAPLRAADSSWVASSWESWSQGNPSQSQLAVNESAHAGACGQYQAFSWATQSEKQKKC